MRLNIVAFVEDEAAWANDRMAKVDGAFRHRPEVLGITGSVIPLWIGRSVSWFPRSLYWVIGCTAWRQEDRESLTWSVAGVNMIFRRKAFDTTSFIDEFTDEFHKEGKMGLPGDNNDFATRLILATGFKLMYIPELKVYHKVYPFKTSLTYVRRYSFWQGCAEARYSMRYPSKMRKRPRNQLLTTTLQDLFLIDRWWPKRILTIAVSAMFGFLGYVYYRNKILQRAFFTLI